MATTNTVPQTLAAPSVGQHCWQSRHAIAAQHEAPDRADPPGTSASSEKSIRASTSASASINRRRQASARSPIRPLSCRNACRRCAGVSAAIRSARPSTAVRSSRPFSKARRVNSPGSASRQPSILPSASRTPGDDRRTAMKLQLGRTSSPVSLCGAGNHSAKASSITSPVAGSRSRASAALRGSGNAPASFSSAGAAADPEDAHHRNRRRRTAGGQGEDGGTITHSLRLEAYAAHQTLRVTRATCYGAPMSTSPQPSAVAPKPSRRRDQPVSSAASA